MRRIHLSSSRPKRRQRNRPFSIGLSLKGEGKVVTLTPQTIHLVYQAIQWCSFLKKTGWIASQFRWDWISDSGAKTSAVDRLSRAGDADARFSAGEIERIERQMNALLIRGALRLDFTDTLSTSVAVHHSGIDRRKSEATILNGAILELRAISLAQLHAGGPRDVLIESPERDRRFLRYLGLETESPSRRPMVRWASRYHVSRSWLEELSETKTIRRIWQVVRACPTKGFHLAEISPFLKGA